MFAPKNAVELMVQLGLLFGETPYFPRTAGLRASESRGLGWLQALLFL